MSALAALALGISQSWPLAVAVKATALLGAGLAAAALLRRARAAVRHAVLAATFGALLLLPLAAGVAPAVDVEVATRTTAAAPSGSTPAHRAAAAAIGSLPASSPPRAVPLDLLPAIWAGGAVLFVLPVLLSAARLSALRRSGLPWPGAPAAVAEVLRGLGVDVLRHEHAGSPLTWGLRRPVILLPADADTWSREDLTRALVHEREHVRRRDWAVLFAARVACALYWWHPLAWTAWRRLGLEAERACDDAVLACTDGPAYARQLVDLAARGSSWRAAPVPGMARRSDLSRRVQALLDSGQRRGRAGGGVTFALGAAALLLVAAVAPLRAAVAVVDAADRERTAARPSSADTGRARAARALDTALFDAARQGDLQSVIELVRRGADVDAVLLGDGSPLIAAAHAGDLTLARTLLELGADPDLPVPGDGSPLIAAAAGGHGDVVAALLDRGASIDQVVPGDENALIAASGAGHLDVVRLLVQRGADVTMRVEAPIFAGAHEWRSPLSAARRGGHGAVVALLAAAGARE